MGRMPMRFGRVAAAFEADVAMTRLCESSGSEHSPPPDQSFTDLSDLVKSFMENNDNNSAAEEVEGEEEEEEVVEKSEWSDSTKKEMLESLFGGDEMNEKEKLRGEVELACAQVREDNSLPNEFKRRLMSQLRNRGFDAGLCKSKWEKNGRLTAGDYEYIDVHFSGKRYIVEVSLATEFEIARPTSQFSSLLDVFPTIFVGKVEELKRVVKFMGNAIKGSMKRRDLHIPPWRRNRYMQAKWFSSYKRTTNAVSSRSAIIASSNFSPERSIGFEPLPLTAQNCRDDYVNKTGFRIGHLSAAFNSDGFEMQLYSTLESTCID